VTATAATTIEGVSILSRQGARHGDRFDIALSRRGMEVRRHGIPAQLMSWDRVSHWEIQAHDGDVLLTLRGSGATTPLVIPGWTRDDLEVLMRDVTSDVAPHSPDAGEAAAPGVREPVEAAPAQPQRRADRRRHHRRKQPAWKPVVTVVLLTALAAAVTLVLLQSAGVINWRFLGPVA
jgi:hypothetical protein